MSVQHPRLKCNLPPWDLGSAGLRFRRILVCPCGLAACWIYLVAGDHVEPLVLPNRSSSWFLHIQSHWKSARSSVVIVPVLVELRRASGQTGGRERDPLVPGSVAEVISRTERRSRVLEEERKEGASGGRCQHKVKTGKTQGLTELSKMGCPRRPSRRTLAALMSELANCSLLAFLDPEMELRPASLSL